MSFMIFTPHQIRYQDAQSRKSRWVGHVEYMAQNSYANKVFVGKHEGKGPPERPRKDNINIYGKEIG